jgi:hypothetical protein
MATSQGPKYDGLPNVRTVVEFWPVGKFKCQIRSMAVIKVTRWLNV